MGKASGLKVIKEHHNCYSIRCRLQLCVYDTALAVCMNETKDNYPLDADNIVKKGENIICCHNRNVCKISFEETFCFYLVSMYESISPLLD